MSGEQERAIVEQAAGGRKVALSLTGEGEAIVKRLGWRWLAALVRPICLAYPRRRISLILQAGYSEPLAGGIAYPPGVPGDAFTHEGGVGLLTIDGDQDLPMIGRIASVPALSVIDGQSHFRFGNHGSRLRRKIGAAYDRLYRGIPMILDEWRQARNIKADWRAGTVSKGADALHDVLPAQLRSPDAPPAAWFAMHWLEPGGAESWAFEAAEIARAAGFSIVMVADKPGTQSALDRALALTDDTYLAGNVLDLDDWGAFETALMARHNIRVLHIHHSAMAYQALPLIRQIRPDIRVIDSTHIIEYRNGGFVRQSLEQSNLIDLHHVISPVLRDEYLLRHKIPAEKVAYCPLLGMQGQQVASLAEVSPAHPLRIGFLGRLAAQKRPFLFVELCHRLNRKHPGMFTFVMQGSGALGEHIEQLIARKRLGGIIQRREWGPVAEFFTNVDVLVIPSENEGLTLTALEADSNDVLILSADVGSQITVVAPDLLVSRRPHSFLIEAERVLTKLAGDAGYYRDQMAAQRTAHRRLVEQQPASRYFTHYFTELVKDN